MASERCIVVGDGIMGLALAFALARRSRPVLCLDAGPDAGGASVAAGAMLGSLGEVTHAPQAPAENLELSLRLRAAAAYPAWLDALGERASSVPRLHVGTFVVADASRATDVSAATAMATVAAGHGLPVQRVAAEDVPGLSPGAPFDAGPVLYLAAEGWIDARALCASLREACTASGWVRFAHDPVARVVQRGGRACGVETIGGKVIEGDEIVLCAGVSVTSILAASGIDGVPSIVNAKGVGLLFAHDAADAPTVALRTPNREFACGLHVLPGDRARLYAGATNRASRHRDAFNGVNDDEVRYIVEGVTRELVGTLPAMRCTWAASGHRPLPLDGLPIAGRSEVSGLSVASGTYRNGILLAPLIADIVASELDGASAHNPLSPRAAARMPVPPPTPDDLLRAGMAQFADLLHDPAWRERYGRARALLEGGDGEARARGLRFLQLFPRVEMVPELVMELAEQAAEP